MMSPQMIVDKMSEMENYSEYDLKQLAEVLRIKNRELQERKAKLLLFILDAMDKEPYVYDMMKRITFLKYYCDNNYDTMFDWDCEDVIDINTKDFKVDDLEKYVEEVKGYLKEIKPIYT